MNVMTLLWRRIVVLCVAVLLVLIACTAPPGDVPPGDVPPGDAPPGDAPPGDAPPGDVPPGDVPPGEVPPGDVPPGDVPPGDDWTEEQIAGRVSRVIDGDTLDIVVAGEARRVRLLGVDTPESVHPTNPVECYGPEASAFLRELVEGRSVRWATDPSQDAVDRYDRWLALVWLDDGTLVNHELIAQGYATAFNTRSPHAHSAAFREAEEQARTAGLGMWAAGACADDPRGDVTGPRDDDAADVARTSIPTDAAGCPGDGSRAPNAPVAIVAIDKLRETVTIRNVGARSITLDGWWICSIAGGQRHATLDGSLAPDEERVIANDAGESIWSNGNPDPGVLVDPRGRVVSYWPD